MKKLRIDPGCIACGACQFVAPDVFIVSDVSSVKSDIDLQKYESQIKEAVKCCPVGVIKYENNINKKRV